LEIAAAWQELSPSDRQAYEDATPEELFPSSFLLTFQEYHSALFRRWTDAELGKDLEKDPGKGGPKGFH
jgi:hypothetical protein